MAGNAGLTFKLFGEDVSASKALEKVGKDGEKAAGVLGAAFAGLALGQIISDAFDNEKTFAKFNAGWDASPKLAEKAADLAGKLYARGIGESLDQVVGAVDAVGVQMVDLGGTSSGELEKITAGAINIAEVMGVDVVEVTRAAGQMMKNGLAPDAMAAFDIIATGVTSGANASGDLLEVFAEYSPQFAKLGIDGQDALVSIKAGLDNGIFTADLAADAFKEFSIRSIDGSKASGEAYAALGLDADAMATKIAAGGPTATEATSTIMRALGRMTDPVAQQTAGVALFGTQWEDSGAQSILAMDPVRARTLDVKGATERMGDQLHDTAVNKVDKIKRSFENWKTSLVDTKGPIGDVAALAVGLGPDAVSFAGSVGMIILGMRALGFGAAGAVLAAGAPLAVLAAAIAAIAVLVKTAMDNIDRMVGQVQALGRGDFTTASSLRSPAATFGVGSWVNPVSSVVSNGIGRVTSSYGPGRMRPMADGGVVMPSRWGTPALIGEAGEPEAVIPLSKWSQMAGGSGAGGTHIHVHLSGIVASTKDELAQSIVDTINTAQRRGTIPAVIFAG